MEFLGFIILGFRALGLEFGASGFIGFGVYRA